jgi:hypothetical protein
VVSSLQIFRQKCIIHLSFTHPFYVTRSSIFSNWITPVIYGEECKFSRLNNCLRSLVSSSQVYTFSSALCCQIPQAGNLTVPVFCHVKPCGVVERPSGCIFTVTHRVVKQPTSVAKLWAPDISGTVCLATFHTHKSLYCLQFSSTLVAYFTLLQLRTNKLVKIVCLLFRVWTGYNNSQTDGAEEEKLEKGQ